MDSLTNDHRVRRSAAALRQVDKGLYPTASVIIAVYNHFNWLRLILDALRHQSNMDFEVVIADDGSDAETVDAIHRYMATYPEFPVIHSWHTDQGWRKNTALNKAIASSKGEYLIFVDGDCIPHPRFVDDHLRLRKKGVVIGGRRVDITESVSRMVENWSALPQNYFNIVRKAMLRYFREEDFFTSLKQLRHLVHYPFIAGKPLPLKKHGMLGCNMGMYREDLMKINGFDERYLAPGIGEDTDLEVRLSNAGIPVLRSPRYALMIHRHHARLPLDSPDNVALLRAAIDNKTTRTPYGLISPR
ncbi:MAG: glycosyltransferase [Muribaculaceae bacterium]|nr:glycosyltransferase [Muribaculaceae bacterium]